MSTIAEKLTTIAENEQKVYEAGKQAEFDNFWDTYQSNGTRVDYSYAFAGKGWTDEFFKPKYDIYPGIYAKYMFRESNIHDLTGILKNLNISLDLSRCHSVEGMFYGSTVTNIPVLSLKNASTANTGLSSFFYNCTRLVTVEKFIVNNNGTHKFSSTFNYCSKLENIRFEGVIGTNISFQWSTKLSVDSMKSIISALKNYKGTSYESTYSVKFASDCWTALEASGKPYDDGLTTDETLTWKNYVISLGWNV